MRTLWVGLYLLLAGSVPPKKALPILPDFVLPEAQGGNVRLNDFVEAKGVVLIFICNHCPMARRYYPRLNGLAAYTAKLGYPLLAVNPMDSLLYEEETREQMARVAQAAGFAFPYLQDPNQTVSQALDVRYTPEVYILKRTAKGWTVQYHGALDDGMQTQPDKTYVGKTVATLAAGKSVAVHQRASVGCAVYYRNTL